MRTLLFGALFVTAVHVCSAATCTSGTLSSYLALGPGGCTIGGDTISNFQTLSGISGATALTGVQVLITPSGNGFNPSLMFSTSQTASTGSLLESIFTYTISGPSFTGTSLLLANASETVDGAVSDIENFCAAGKFDSTGVSGCTGTAGSLLTLDGIQNTDQSGLSLVSSINVTNDFTLDGGTAGSATGGVFTDSFTAAPEPSSLFFGVLGLALVAFLHLRQTRSSFKH